LSSGFVDLQVNGFAGVDFSAPGLTIDDVRKVVLNLRDRGTVAFCPTVITSPIEIYEENLPILAAACRDSEIGPSILGLHIEGPFISDRDGAIGAHSKADVRLPDLRFFDRLRDLSDDRIVLLTLAPELEGAPDLIRHARSAGVTVSLGHHLADSAILALAYEAGARSITHFGNGIPNFMPRHPNPLWDMLAETRLLLTLITDGHHLPPSVIQVTCACRGTKGIIVVSDSAPIAGLPPGRYHTLGQEVVLETSGKLWNPAGNHLVGSSASMLDCMNHLASLRIFDESGLRQVSYSNPLELLGIEPESFAAPASAVPVFEEGRFTLRQS
jgi:N-acetylglucosamine-6-phosphate deacetylase